MLPIPHLVALTLAGAPAPAAATVEDVEPAPFDPSTVAVDGTLRFEAHAGLWLAQQASRLRTTQPCLGVGLSARPDERLRLDGGYLFSLLSIGGTELGTFNTFHALRVRAHYAHPVGGTWLTLGGGPVGYLVTASHSSGGEALDGGVAPSFGVEGVAGAETEVGGRLVRFEAGVATRSRRWDLHAGLVVGF